LMMITQHISFKSLDIQSLLLYKVCSGHRWNETGEILFCPFCKFYHRICTCYATCFLKWRVMLLTVPEISLGRSKTEGDLVVEGRNLVKGRSRNVPMTFKNLICN
jgi:hypothetical protein